MTATDTESILAPLYEIREPLHAGLSLLPPAAAAVSAGEGWEDPLAAALKFLNEDFVPACIAENFTLLGAVNGIFKSPEAGNVMMHQHDSIKRMVEDLDKVAAAAREIGAVGTLRDPMLALLYGLFAACRVHLDSEETAYFGPIADHLSESQIRILTENLGRISEGQMPSQLAAEEHGEAHSD